MRNALWAGLLALAGTANAQTVIYDTFNEGDQADLFDCCNVVQLPGRDGIGPKSKAYITFTPVADARIVEIDIATGGDTGAGLTVHLYGVNKGLKRSWHVRSLPAQGQCCDFVTLADRNGVEVRAGMPYKLEVLANATSPANVSWNLNSAGLTGSYETRAGSKKWTEVDGTLPAVRIIGR